MSTPWKFNYRPEQLPPGWRPVSAKRAIVDLKERLEDPSANRYEIHVQLALLYARCGMMQEAVDQARACVFEASDPDQAAGGWLKLGQVMEQMYNFPEAIRYYAMVLEVEGCDPWYRYFGLNNTGYSLNQLDRYSEAEPFCRQAIEVDPNRHNAYKNLGVSLEGQGRCVPAVRAYILAVRQNASDPRALKHLEDLLLRNPGLLDSEAGLSEEVENCRRAVRAVELRNRAQG